MSTSRKFLRGLLESEEGQRRLQEIWDEVTTKRVQTITVAEKTIVYGPDTPQERAKLAKKGLRNETIRKVPVEVEVYPLRDLDRLLGLALSFGVGKPPEEKKVEININQRIEEMTDAELASVAEYRELPSG